jgi:uncharacterized protein YkwD
MARTVPRTRKIAFLASLALVAAAVLLLAGPLSAAANASPCKRFGKDMPRDLSHRHARMAVRCLLNRKRENHGLHRLGKSGRLKEAAQRHTNYMEDHRCFAHVCPGEASVLSRLKEVNYIVGGLRSWRYGENIAYGGSHLGTPKAIVRGWMHSPGHRHNILDPRLRQIGIGFVRGIPAKPGAGGSTITTDFGMRKH